MNKHSHAFRRFSKALCLLGAGAVLGGCADKLGPLPKDDPALQALDGEREKFREKKVALIEEAMDLDDKEHDAFWRVYYQYEDELKKIYDERYRLLRAYAEHYDGMTNDIADALAERALKLKEMRNDLAHKYYHKMKKATSAITAARFLQLDNEITLLSDLKISSEMPIFPKGMNPLDVK